MRPERRKRPRVGIEAPSDRPLRQKCLQLADLALPAHCCTLRPRCRCPKISPRASATPCRPQHSTTPIPRDLAIAAPSDYNEFMEPSFDHMTPAERILYVQDLWDRIAAEPDYVPLSEIQRLELRRRVEEHRADPGSAVPWEQVLTRARNR